MIKKPINQNDYFNLELINSVESKFVYSNKPINRLKNHNNSLKEVIHNKIEKIENLKNEINSINNCKLKEGSKKIVLGDGDIDSEIMLIGSLPGQKEELAGKTYQGESGTLLGKMLIAIGIKKQNIYTAYSINFRPPNDRRPSTEEIQRYGQFLKKHISIADPKLIILMGSIATEILIGSNNKISSERGKWKEIILQNKSYDIITTFSPSYLLRFPENKKYSWEDLKKIKQKIIDLSLTVK
jgi:uracil-DNA glycosylase